MDKTAQVSNTAETATHLAHVSFQTPITYTMLINLDQLREKKT